MMKCAPLVLLIFSFFSVDGYPNVTLTSGQLAVTVYLPRSLSGDGEQVFYESTRFDHGSMIGSIRRKKTRTSGSSNRFHELYGANLWRAPHNPFWPESGVGLASEFGVGDDGDFCTYRCGWYGVNNVTNGVLGYQEARHGESFLKIGVGELIKGTCQSCDITGVYKFNSPYQFASLPLWSMYQPSVDKLILEHEAHLKSFGYRIRKEIRLVEDTLLVTTTLTNLGLQPFATAWYSHHFFSCDDLPIGAGYSVEMEIEGMGREKLYDEPGYLAGWSSELSDYADISPAAGRLNIDLMKTIEPGRRIKAEFRKDDNTEGSFTLIGCGTRIREDLPDVHRTPIDPVSMYGFNLYMERDTLSPEPQLLIQLESSHSKTWTQRLIFSDASFSEDTDKRPPLFYEQSVASVLSPHHRIRPLSVSGVTILLIVASFAFALLAIRRQHPYSPIPDMAGEA
jgi:hypothetical protein